MSEPLQTPRPPLRRSSTDRMIGGVCGGIARTLGIDTVVVRVIVAVLGILGGAGFAAYAIAWILIPSDDGTTALQRSDGRRRAGQWFLILILAISVASLIDSWLPGHDNGVGFLVVLAIAGLLWQAFGSDWYRRTTVTHATEPTGAGFAVTQEDNAATISTPLGTTTIRQERRSHLGSLSWNVIVVTVGVLIATNWADITSLSGRAIAMIALAEVGVALLVSAFIGRARGLIALGIALSLFLAGGMHVDLGHGAGNRTWAPATIAEATSATYDLGMGDATLDLRTLTAGMAATGDATIYAHVGAGNLRVYLPQDALAQFDVHASVSAGDIALPDLPRESGVNHSRTVMLGSSGPILHLYLSTDLGNLEVRYA